MAEPRYGSFDGIPSRADEREAWVLHSTGWVGLNRIDHGNAVRELTKEEFDQLFPDVPPLPSTAFRSEFTKRRDRQLLAELTPWERSIVQQAMDNCPGATLAETIAMLKAAGM